MEEKEGGKRVNEGRGMDKEEEDEEKEKQKENEGRDIVNIHLT